MFEEHYRYLESIQNRRDYIEDQIRTGSPVIGLVYDDGILILTLTSSQKLYEVHNHLALSAIGHIADIERLRLLVTDSASVQGFQSSIDDVTLHRLTNFVLCPPIKQSFESVFNPPTVAKILLAELGRLNRPHQLVTVNYDGTTAIEKHVAVIGGSEDTEQLMRNYIDQTASRLGDKLTLQDAFELAIQTWAVGRMANQRSNQEMQLEAGVADYDVEQLNQCLQTELIELQVEVGTLQTSKRGKSKFRSLTDREIASFLPFEISGDEC
jgi:proteasome alpha subunit|tara:strand:- start:241 stop:1044 length:804 start_codon:yes stop_codon:yes gene_type:complete